MARTRERSRDRTASEEKAEPKKQSKEMRRFIELSYRLIECKICYYYPELIREGFRSQLETSDAEYDKLEREYLDLCVLLKQPNTVSHASYREDEIKGDGMFEVDFSRPAVHLVMRKWGVKNWQDKAPMKRAVKEN